MRPQAAAVAVLLLGLTAAPAAADDVHLTNGKVFEGVIAEWRGDQLVLHVPGGELTLARASVREVVVAESGYRTYLARERALRGRADAGAREWLELATLALDADLRQPAREAALEAAAREPRLAGLAPVLRALGYELYERESVWLPRDEVMRRRGFLLHDGRWITREEAALERAETAAREREREAQTLARLERAALHTRLAAAEFELRRAAAPAPAPVVVYVQGQSQWPPFLIPITVPVPAPWPPAMPWPPPPSGGHHDGQQRGTSGQRSGLEIDILQRQPGSLFPARWSSSDGH